MIPLVVSESADDLSFDLGHVVAGRLGAPLLAAEEARPADLETADVLVLGSPTHRRIAGARLRALLASVEPGWLVGVRTATFDARPRRSRLLTGSAARDLSRRAARKGAVIVLPPRSFFVSQDGTLLDGELEAAGDWAGAIIRAIGVRIAVPAQPVPKVDVLGHEYPESLVTPLALQGVSQIKRLPRRKERAPAGRP